MLEQLLDAGMDYKCGRSGGLLFFAYLKLSRNLEAHVLSLPVPSPSRDNFAVCLRDVRL